ncbi:MAG: thioredoxin family protein, partial [Proteobacteria bacterium]|nr:thioredoxin family protein [Pseudomonadota bacterium]
EKSAPPEVQLVIALGPGDGGRATARRDLFAAARGAMPLPSLWPSMAVVGADKYRVTVYLDPATLDQTAEMRFLPGHPGLVDAGRPMRLETGDAGLEITGRRVRGAPYIEMVDGLLLLLDAAGETIAGYEIEAWNDIRPLRDPLLSAADDGRDLSVALALLFALLGGVILNLMPCVFPVLSMKLFALVRAGAHSPRRMRLDAIAYTAGILVSFLLVAGALLVFRGLGQEVGWGFQLQSPGFVLVLALLLTLVGLNLAGMFEISTSAFAGIGAGLAGKEGTGGAFFTGVLATVVATPCTAPFMAPALGYALSQPAPVALAVFLALGLGLALPYLLVGMIPALHKHFPKPGPWMDSLRKWLALPMFATVVWLLWVLRSQTVPGGLGVALAGIIGLVILVLAAKRFRGLGDKVRRALRWPAYAAVILLAGGYQVWANNSLQYSDRWEDRPSLNAEPRYEEVAFSRARLAELRRLGKPVFLNFTATWCITCIITDKLVFETGEFSRFMRDNGIIMMKADWTKPDDEIARMLESFGRSGIPFYVFYPANPNRPAVPLPEILTVDRAIGLISKHLD